MNKAKRTYEMDMVNGPLTPKIMRFAVPLMLTSMLQLLYNAADVIVVGRFSGNTALAAVGSTSALINLIVNIFLGLSVGTNVVAANYYGAGNYRATSETVHTSITVSLIGGVAVGIFGFAFCGTFLEMMGSPEDVLGQATLYMKIYFVGMPFNMLYNFGAAVLRAVGDTRRPLYFLTFAGVVNIVLNLIFVILFHMGVAGVALATIISQLISAALVFTCLRKSDGFIHLEIQKLRVHGDKLKEMLRVGLPAGLQGACFSISNVLIQSTVNGYGSTVVAGNSASSNLENFIYVSMNAFHQAAVTFVSSNIGAGKNSRIKRACTSSVMLVTLVGLGMGAVFYLLRYVLLGIYSPDPEVVSAALIRLDIISPTYFLCGIMDVLCGVMRGMGASIVPMAVSVVGACGFRILWIYAILPLAPSLQMLYYSYPISWVLTGGAHLFCYFVLLKRFPAERGIVYVEDRKADG